MNPFVFTALTFFLYVESRVILSWLILHFVLGLHLPVDFWSFLGLNLLLLASHMDIKDYGEGAEKLADKYL